MYEQNLDENLRELHRRLKEQEYHAQPAKRVYIEKEGGKKRALGLPAFEDKIVQKAVAMLLEAIYEQDFQAFSYGFRPRKSAHQALHHLREAGMQGWLNWMVDADIQGFFDQLDPSVLRDLLHRRVKDGGIERLLGKWFNAGIMEAGELSHPERGTLQGSVISPILSNIYLHTVLDEWFEQVVRPHLKGRALLIRYADDFVIGFEREDDARRLMEVLPKRLGKHGLSLHPEKSRLVRFHRMPKNAPADPENDTFDFLGFTHYWGKSHQGHWVIKRRIMDTRRRRSLKGLWTWCKKHRHDRVSEQRVSLCQKLRGLYQYYGIQGNAEALWEMYGEVVKMWKYWQGRCSQKSGRSWKEFRRLLERLPLPEPRIVHWTV